MTSFSRRKMSKLENRKSRNFTEWRVLYWCEFLSNCFKLNKLFEIWISCHFVNKNNLRGITMGIGPIWESSSLTLYPLWHLFISYFYLYSCFAYSFCQYQKDVYVLLLFSSWTLYYYLQRRQGFSTSWACTFLQGAEKPGENRYPGHTGREQQSWRTGAKTHFIGWFGGKPWWLDTIFSNRSETSTICDVICHFLFDILRHCRHCSNFTL